jgi:two-component system chemotaxis sensor kinase CheA
MDIDREALLQTFLAESDEYLRALEESLVSLEARPNDEQGIQEIFRLVHNLKGSASCVGLQSIPEFTHVLENLLDDIRSGAVPVTGGLISLLLESMDSLRDMTAVASPGADEMISAHRSVMERLAKWRDLSDEEKIDASAPALIQAETANSPGQSRTLRVDIDKLDRIMTLTSEIAISRARIKQMIDGLGGQRLDALREVRQEADRLYLELQEQVTKIRMVPVGPGFRQYIRMVRDLAKAHGKVATLTIEGADVEVDTTVVQRLREPLTHLLRNALDHGIERPEVRRACGKDPCGHVLLRARHDAASIVIQISDDGAGLDRDSILRRALDTGVIRDGQKLADHEVFELIFQQGLSTAEAVSDLSGRGIGMDIVRRNIEAIRGVVAVESRKGEGATITMRLPLTLAIIDGLAVRVSEETYIIPLESVIECLELPPGEPRAGREGVINLRGEPVPYIRLRQLLKRGDDIPHRENVVIVQHMGGKAGLVADALEGESQAVIKPLGKPFHDLPGISGTTILGSGRVAIVLDVPALLCGPAQTQWLAH